AEAAAWPGCRFRPMPSTTEMTEVVRAIYELMEQLPLSGEEAKGVRKALRQLQVVDRSFIQENYVNLCFAAKAGGEEEIREIFEEIRQRAADLQQQQQAGGPSVKTDAG
ncbi:hypothetical protein Agub_g10124, partial [Astrephomene gubernaculifera]